ncbi:hypothetical protein D3C86_1954480 [compost metagenome]
MQVGAFEGFGQVIIHACRQAGLAIALQGIGGEGDDRYIGLVGEAANLPGGFIAIHDRQAAIHQDGGKVLALDALQRLGAIADQADPVSQAA